MEISLRTENPAALETGALITYLFETNNRISGALSEWNVLTGGLLERLAEGGELTGKAFEMTLLHRPAGFKAERLLLVGAGKPEKFHIFDLRKLAAAALRYLKSRSVKRMVFWVGERERSAVAAQAVTEGFLYGNFEVDAYKTEKQNQKSVEAAGVAGWDSSARGEAEKGIAAGLAIGEAQNFARSLINEPSNKLTPSILAERAEAMARQVGLGVEVLDEKRIAELRMGALLSVAQGSAEPPRFIVVTYTPPGAAAGAPVLGLVGKAVTFETGGISIKPSEGLEKMKYDMAGGATMLGVMMALARLKPALKVIACIPATENMPGGRAQKPGDIQTAMSGKTIEVLNTDAEGRLILADGITYARRLGCTHIVDAATLTGAVIVALANVNVGVFGSDQKFTDRLLSSAGACAEKMWQLPVDDDYREFIKGTFADIQNISSGKGGGAIIGAMFLKEFSEETPWIHLDIAGTAWLDDSKPWSAKGATGVALRTLVHLALNFS
jgi:leucyl aminopeptidase